MAIAATGKNSRVVCGRHNIGIGDAGKGQDRRRRAVQEHGDNRRQVSTQTVRPSIDDDRSQDKERQYADPGQNHVAEPVAVVIENVIPDHVIVAASWI
jgi:hypothetical protein